MSAPMAGTTTAPAAAFRVCPTTGLKVHRDAEALIKANAVVATVALLIGGFAAILVLLTRWQAVHLLSDVMFYRWLTIHGMNMLIFFILFFEMAVLYFASAVLLNSRVAGPKWGWVAFGLMVGGAGMVEWTMFTGQADVLFTSYVPLRAHPAFYLGVILFAVGAIIVTTIFFATMVVAKREATYTGSVPLVTFGALTAAIIAAITLTHGAAIYIPTFLWSIGLMSVDPQVYRLVWWGLGHSSQQINVAAMVSIWYLLGALTVGAVVVNEKISRTAFVLYIAFISMASAHHLLVDPGFGPTWKIVNTSYFMYMAVLASMLHGFTVPAGIELGMRLRGFTEGIFGWLRRAPWGDPGFSALCLSVVVFGFVGGITGVTFGTEQINIVAHNTLRIPAHFHATVVSGTALAFMGITYYVIPLIFQKKVSFYGLARWQPYVFSIGMLVFVLGFMFAGTFGVPRRHYDITFAGAPFTVEYSPAANLMLAIGAIGGLVAAVGGGMYILVTVWSVFFGKPLGADCTDVALAGTVPPGIYKRPFTELPTEDVELEEHGTLGMMPGTMILVAIFFVAFVVYYFANWNLLSRLWQIG
ncbi:MAG: cbb3-type cytochrome c oxidase subunit I [Gemmatimonadota bacterium]|nr:cbb3-type cytochrome c oxidase subunit I [Gemmatimonadota bacterium]MDH3424027.1 cbb3-type cytochrome c oxidase subunit I [Gemmatimonadota bacterium]